jgi:hypothetical protein
MKNLANCTPTEFLAQTNKIRKSVRGWLKLTDIMNIRQKRPKLTPLTNEMSDEERAQVILDNKEAMKEQARENFNLMLDKMLDDYPEQTLEVIGLINFIDKSELDNYKMVDLMANTLEMLEDEAVMGFFGLLMRLGSKNTSSVAQK